MCTAALGNGQWIAGITKTPLNPGRRDGNARKTGKCSRRVVRGGSLWQLASETPFFGAAVLTFKFSGRLFKSFLL